MELRKFDRFLAMIQPEQASIPNIKNTNNTQDIPGAKPDAFGKLKNIHGRDYNSIEDIVGAKPSFLEKPAIHRDKDYKLLTKDITEANRRHYVKDHNPLEPKYVVSTKSGRRQIIGEIERNKPTIHIRKPFNADTRRCLRTDDIDGAQPFYKRSGNRRIKSEINSFGVRQIEDNNKSYLPQMRENNISNRTDHIDDNNDPIHTVPNSYVGRPVLSNLNTSKL